MNPPRWAEWVLRLLLKPRDRETVTGDLYEEYHESILPSRGILRARLWYLRQVASFASPLAVGVLFGLVLGTWNLIDTAIAPLQDDAGGVMFVVAGGLLATWSAVAFFAGRRRRFHDAVIAGLLVGLATIAVFHVAAIVRINLFIDVIQQRGDWQNLVARFHASGFQSLRAYATYEYVMGTPFALALGSMAGALSGAIAGFANVRAR